MTSQKLLGWQIVCLVVTGIAVLIGLEGDERVQNAWLRAIGAGGIPLLVFALVGLGRSVLARLEAIEVALRERRS